MCMRAQVKSRAGSQAQVKSCTVSSKVTCTGSQAQVNHALGLFMLCECDPKPDIAQAGALGVGIGPAIGIGSEIGDRGS
eukprot:5296896-Alexandrium_andersonii.AAC.1